jgi:hypothetical protein
LSIFKKILGGVVKGAKVANQIRVSPLGEAVIEEIPVAGRVNSTVNRVLKRAKIKSEPPTPARKKKR